MPDLLFVGVDGGGTGCRARVRDGSAALVGEASGGTANLFTGGKAAIETIVAVIGEALAKGGLSAADLSRCHVGLGLAGANIPGVAEAFHRRPLPFAAYALETDAATACRGAFGGEDGAIAILGTGTAYALIADGDCRLLGGWGMLVSDQGSGADLGRRALAAGILAFDGIFARTGFCAALLDAFDDSPSAIAEFARDGVPRDFGRFAPMVWDHFDEGDAVARRLVAESLAAIEPMLHRLLALGAPRLALLGGLAPRYRQLLSPPLRERIVDPSGDAMDGALQLARTIAATPPAKAARA